jgi:hypothetical protein
VKAAFRRRQPLAPGLGSNGPAFGGWRMQGRCRWCQEGVARGWSCGVAVQARDGDAVGSGGEVGRFEAVASVAGGCDDLVRRRER